VKNSNTENFAVSWILQDESFSGFLPSIMTGASEQATEAISPNIKISIATSFSSFLQSIITSDNLKIVVGYLEFWG
jgi:hypothetical protein